MAQKVLKDASTLLGIDVKIKFKIRTCFGSKFKSFKTARSFGYCFWTINFGFKNKESFICWRKISMQTSSSVTDGETQRTNYEREDIGLTLKIKTRVSSDTNLL